MVAHIYNFDPPAVRQEVETGQSLETQGQTAQCIQH